MRRGIKAALVSAVVISATGLGLTSASAGSAATSTDKPVQQSAARSQSGGSGVTADAPVHTAGVADCEQTVAANGYPVGPKVTAACSIPAPNPPAPTYGERLDCQNHLQGLAVASNVAIEACWKV